MALSAEDLHAAADIVGSFGDDESRIGQEYGLPVEVLKEFIDGSAWRDRDPYGPLREMDPLALAIGVSIGVIAAHVHAWGDWQDDPAGVVRECACGAVDSRPEG